MGAFTLRVNGVVHQVEAEPATPLIFVLRGQLGLMGPKLGCGLEQCGACAVLVDGESTLSCVRAVSEFENADIVTVEGMAADRAGADIQRVFVEEGAAHCGYCTPGLVVATAALLARNRSPDDGAIREALNDHLCRCGSHNRVLRAVRRLAGEGSANV